MQLPYECQPLTLIAFFVISISKIPILASVLPIASISNALFLINQVSLDVTYNPKRTPNPRPRVQDNALVLTAQSILVHIILGTDTVMVDMAGDQVAAAEPVLMAVDGLVMSDY